MRNIGGMIQVQINPQRFTRWLTNVAHQQVPFAAARSLTELAKYGQVGLRQRIQEEMHVRRPWVLKGIAVTPAQKRDGLAGMKAEVGSRDWFMSDQLGNKSAVREGKGKQFLPKAARKSPAANIPARLRPAPVTAEAKSGGRFFFKQGRGGRSVLFQKMRGDRLRMIYTVGKQQTVAPKFSLEEEVARMVLRRGEREFIRQMQAAIKSAK